MARPVVDEHIDRLYQLPLDDFTAARNALAKESGDANIKRLEKPNAAAWAINQLYWRERKLFDEVIKTAGQIRAAHKAMLVGKASDVRAAEVFRHEAMRKAKAAIRRMLEEAGNQAADAVMTPVTETLDALPSEDPPGRLTRPLRRTGFEALQGVTIAAKGKAVSAKPVPAKTEPPKQAVSEAAQQQLAMNKERLRFAEAAEREAAAALERAARAVERAAKTRERIEGELEEAATAEKAARKEQAASESTYEKAKAERDRLAKKVSSA